MWRCRCLVQEFGLELIKLETQTPTMAPTLNTNTNSFIDPKMWNHPHITVWYKQYHLTISMPLVWSRYAPISYAVAKTVALRGLTKQQTLLVSPTPYVPACRPRRESVPPAVPAPTCKVTANVSSSTTHRRRHCKTTNVVCCHFFFHFFFYIIFSTKQVFKIVRCLDESRL